MSHPVKKPAAASGAVGAKTARACDSCLKRRARWYCTADDAFLCQPCDNSVHSANPLARRHERVRLKTASSSPFRPRVFVEDEPDAEPAWHNGFQRKARTPRGSVKGSMKERTDTVVVPDLDLACLEEFVIEEEEQLIYRVPILDPVLAEMCSTPTSKDETKREIFSLPDQPVHGAAGFVLPSDMDMDEFDVDVDVECLLGRGLDEDAFSMEELGLVEIDIGESVPTFIKKEEKIEVDPCAEGFDFGFHDGSPGDEKPVITPECNGWCVEKSRKILLDLNHEGVICAWDKQASPWVDGVRPQLDLENWSPEFMLGAGGEVQRAMRVGGHAGGGREARVSRYREKRRSRLFSKKIRYEVRKLNAEKRPRMKGRFVKRSSLLSNTTSINGGVVVPHPKYVF